jgi:hypothetical protein
LPCQILTDQSILCHYSSLTRLQTIAITRRSYRLKGHATVAGKEDKNKKGKSKSSELSTAEPVASHSARRFCSFYFAADALWTTLAFHCELVIIAGVVLALV